MTVLQLLRSERHRGERVPRVLEQRVVAELLLEHLDALAVERARLVVVRLDALGVFAVPAATESSDGRSFSRRWVVVRGGTTTTAFDRICGVGLLFEACRELGK